MTSGVMPHFESGLIAKHNLSDAGKSELNEKSAEMFSA